MVPGLDGDALGIQKAWWWRGLGQSASMERLVWLPMNRTLPIIGVLLLILGVMVACTDIEVRFVRWFNCGPLSTPNEQTSEVCR